MPRPVRIALIVVAIAVAVVVLFTWVFPWVEERTQNPTMGLGPDQVLASAVPAQLLR